jgi:hypothetical protein
MSLGAFAERETVTQGERAAQADVFCTRLAHRQGEVIPLPGKGLCFSKSLWRTLDSRCLGWHMTAQHPQETIVRGFFLSKLVEAFVNGELVKKGDQTYNY